MSYLNQQLAGMLLATFLSGMMWQMVGDYIGRGGSVVVLALPLAISGIAAMTVRNYLRTRKQEAR